MLEREALVLGAFGVQDTDHLVGDHDRHGELAARRRQPRQRDLALQLLGQAGGADLLADGAAVGVLGGGVRDADRRPLRGGHADHAVAERDLGTEARGVVAAAGDHEQPRRAHAAGVEQQQHRVRDAEFGVQRRQRVVEQRRQVGVGGDAAGQRPQQGQRAAARLGRRRARTGHRLDRQHAVDVRAAQPEHAGHAGVRGDAGQPRAHRLEQRPGLLGAEVAQLQPPAAAGPRVDHQRSRIRVGEDVLARLVEELEAQRDVLAVDVVHLRHVGHVRRAVQAAAGQQRRNLALEAGAQCGKGRVHPEIRSPARGPGVCANTAAGAKRTASSRSGEKLKNARSAASS